LLHSEFMTDFAVEIHDLEKEYPGGTKALKGVNLQVPTGSFFALLGPNGAGKTTLLEILSHLQRKTKGQISICGIDLSEHPTEAKAQLGVVPQEFNFSVFETIEDILVKQAGYYGISRNIALTRSLQLLKDIGLGSKIGQPAFRLSGGMKRRLMVARALVHEPRVLLLDEPTTGVDVEMRRSLWAFLSKLNRSGMTIILTTHYLEEAENLSDNIAIINQGKIIGSYKTRDITDYLTEQTFIADCFEKVDKKMLSNAPFSLEKEGMKSIKFTLTKDQSLNEVFHWLDRNGIKVKDIALKTGRLETLMTKILGGV
jgi:ABC-2 type transport system ATP-binding protein